MDNQKMQQLQQQFLEMQSKVIETATSQNVEVTMDGKMEIISLKINTWDINESVIEELKTTVNTVIKQASQKMPATITRFSFGAVFLFLTKRIE